MGELRGGAAQVPAPEKRKPVAGADATAEAFEQGIELGRIWARNAAVQAKAWAEENPGQMLLVGLAAGFVLGKLLFRPSRRRVTLDDLRD